MLNRVQNDIGDEMAALGTEIWTQLGEAEAERFKRLYAEESLALHKDAQLSPLAYKSWVCATDDNAEKHRPYSANYAENALRLPGPNRKGNLVGWSILVIIALAAVMVL